MRAFALHTAALPLPYVILYYFRLNLGILTFILRQYVSETALSYFPFISPTLGDLLKICDLRLTVWTLG